MGEATGKKGKVTLFWIFGRCHVHHILQTARHFHVRAVLVACPFDARPLLFGYGPVALKNVATSLC